MTARALPNLEEDGRLLPMLNNLSKRYLGQDYDSKKIRTGEITTDMVDGVIAFLTTEHLNVSLEMNQTKIIIVMRLDNKGNSVWKR